MAIRFRGDFLETGLFFNRLGILGLADHKKRHFMSEKDNIFAKRQMSVSEFLQAITFYKDTDTNNVYVIDILQSNATSLRTSSDNGATWENMSAESVSSLTPIAIGGNLDPTKIVVVVKLKEEG